MAETSQSSRQPIFLTGLPASGKTTFGRALAKALGYDFIDLDFYIEQRYRTKISDIFSRQGEEAFRDMERRMLREAGEFDGCVIACGGGTPCFHANMDYMNSRGLTVWLRAGTDRIVSRLLAARTSRPLAAGKDEDAMRQYVGQLISTRGPWYARARMQLDSSRLETRSQIEECVAGFTAILASESRIPQKRASDTENPKKLVE